ncbi:MAG: alanine dehydrogenase [Chloroflexota bacterium]
MGKVRVLNAGDVARAIGMDEVLALVEKAFAERGEGRVQMPPKSYLFFKEHGGDLRVMPAFLESLGQAGVKLVNVHPGNPEAHGLPTVMATIVLVNPETGEPLCIMDGTDITAMRTAAASGVATRYLARAGSTTLGLIGAGYQSLYQLDAISRVVPLERITIYDVIREKADKLAHMAARRLGLDVDACATAAEAVRGKDIVVTATPSTSPIVEDEWVSEGVHFNCVGADAPGKQELQPAILTRARIVIDDWEQASHSGEINVPVNQGLLSRSGIAAEIGEVVAGLKEGRTSESEITVFDTTGLAIQDVICAWKAYEVSIESDLGIEIDSLFGSSPQR